MTSDSPHDRPQPADPAGGSVVVAPVVVLTQTFEARPGSLPDATAFVRSALAGSPIAEAELRAINVAIVDALLIAAGPAVGSFQVVMRLFPDDVEIEVLSSSSTHQTVTGSSEGATFAQWFSEVLRRDGMSQATAARQLGVSVRTVSRWVRGQTEPRLRDVGRISGVFGPVPHH
jgi:DNA-binding XRE family transcriptional regulator